MIAGSRAPSFSADALFNGKSLSISLEDYKGKWVVLLFYSGDFSFV